MRSEPEPPTVRRLTCTLQTNLLYTFTFPIIFSRNDRNSPFNVGRVFGNTDQHMIQVENVGRELDGLSPHRINEQLLIASLSFHVIIPVAAQRQYQQYQKH